MNPTNILSPTRPILNVSKSFIEENITLTIDEQVREQLEWHRRSIPFPGDPKEAYYECFHPTIVEWIRQGYFDTFPSDVRIGNSVLLMIEPRALGNVTLPWKAQMSVRWIDNGAECELDFWVALHGRAPGFMASHRRGEIMYPPDGPLYREIIEWGRRATALEQKIDEWVRYVRNFAPLIPTASEAAMAWPELMHFVNYRSAHCPPVRAKQKRELLAKSREKDSVIKEDIIAMLSAAVLLKGNNTPLPAWIGIAYD